jgi:lysophospholipase L1-like esterase
MNRRNFFKKTAAAGAVTLLIPEIVNSAMSEFSSGSENYGVQLSKGNVILFQGDSITDAGRDRANENNANDQQMLGHGYPLFAAASILAGHVSKDLKIYNRGISGNRVSQLARRWDKDCLNLKPDVISILIGVNNYWHKVKNGYTGTLKTYIADYRTLIARTQKELPQVKIVICEPFLIHGGTALDDTWEPNFKAYRQAAKTIANEFKATFIPFQSVYNEALKKAPAVYWGADGVHPSLAGAQLMAQAWLKCIQ